mmetsp:Transcript_65303/g.113853  ORF Transcript_65303/g.113853 Transcript_65303/m.113853 type:complete len:257 (+) Transcript_65303:17-787(+)
MLAPMVSQVMQTTQSITVQAHLLRDLSANDFDSEEFKHFSLTFWLPMPLPLLVLVPVLVLMRVLVLLRLLWALVHRKCLQWPPPQPLALLLWSTPCQKLELLPLDPPLGQPEHLAAPRFALPPAGLVDSLAPAPLELLLSGNLEILPAAAPLELLPLGNLGLPPAGPLELSLLLLPAALLGSLPAAMLELFVPGRLHLLLGLPPSPAAPFELLLAQSPDPLLARPLDPPLGFVVEQLLPPEVQLPPASLPSYYHLL